MEKDSIGVKRRDIQRCAGCGGGVLHDSMLAFYIVRADYVLVDLDVVKGFQENEITMGRAAALAHHDPHIGPDDDFARQAASTTIWVCVKCAIRWPLIDLVERQLTAKMNEPPP